MSESLKKFYETKKGKKLLKKNRKKLLKDLKKERGWFSKKEDLYWKNFRDEIKCQK